MTICLHLCNSKPFAVELQRKISNLTSTVTAVTARLWPTSGAFVSQSFQLMTCADESAVGEALGADGR